MDALPVGWVSLNVGGTLFLTTKDTLLMSESELLNKMFSDQWQSQLARDSTGAYLIDADPKYFRVILNYLRRGELVIPVGVNSAGVLSEAKFFGIKSVIEQLGGSTVVEEPVQWKDIGGLSGVKRELQQLVEHSVRYSGLFNRCGVSPSKNLLLYGPPGCGKTMLAKATAYEMHANFMLVKCPELLAGNDGHKLVQEKFKQAQALQPCVMFLEEFECIARMRPISPDQYIDPIISQVAISLDFVLNSDKIFVIAATNRPDLIETALLRPGRFDQLLYIPMPDEESRVQILQTALRKAPVEEALDLDAIAKLTSGMSGADLGEITSRACKFAIREHLVVPKEPEELRVKQEHLESALGYARKSVTETDVYRFEQFNAALETLRTSVV